MSKEKERVKQILHYLIKIIWLGCKKLIRILKTFIRENKWLRITNTTLKIREMRRNLTKLVKRIR